MARRVWIVEACVLLRVKARTEAKRRKSNMGAGSKYRKLTVFEQPELKVDGRNESYKRCSLSSGGSRGGWFAAKVRKLKVIQAGKNGSHAIVTHSYLLNSD